MRSVRLACHAMGTRFEFLLYGSDARLLRAAGEEAIAEIKRLHDLLSAFRDQSLVSRINKRASDGPVRVNAELFHLLSRVERLSEITDGAFDITVGPLLALWGFRGGREGIPGVGEVESALSRVGTARLILDKRTRTVSFEAPGMQIDLGGVGKGYALDVAAGIIEGVGIGCALLHGGTSTVRAIGVDVGGDPWRIAVKAPFATAGSSAVMGHVELQDEAMSVSAGSGRVVESDGQVYGHVIDPRNGYPVDGTQVAVAVLPTAMYADALSTGLLVLGRNGLADLNRHVVGFRGAVLENGAIHQLGDLLLTDTPKE